MRIYIAEGEEVGKKKKKLGKRVSNIEEGEFTVLEKCGTSLRPQTVHGKPVC